MVMEVQVKSKPPEARSRAFKKLLRVANDMELSLHTLYEEKPEIAGEYFGAALSERLKATIVSAQWSRDERIVIRKNVQDALYWLENGSSIGEHRQAKSALREILSQPVRS